MLKRQVSDWVRMPPSSSPTEAPAPAIAENTPNALARSAGSVNVVVKSDSADGASSAPNAPWNVRAAASMANDWAAPPTADAAANPARPASKVHLRPNRSLRRPPSAIIGLRPDRP